MIPQRSLAAAGLTAILLMFAAHVVYLNCVVEDAYITFRYSRHLMSGLGLVWNAGEAPVEGYTNFLWVVVIAAAIALGLDAPLFSQIAGFTFGAATIVLVYDAGRRLANWPRAVALVAPLLLAVSGPFATWSGSGMETVPFAFLVFGGLYAYGCYWQSDRPMWLVVMSVALVAAALMRPEGAIVFAVLIALSVVLAIGDFQRRLGHFAIAVASWLVPFGAYFAWRYRYFGQLLPNTFYAKTGGGRDQIERGLLTTAQFYWQFVTPLVPAVLVGVWESAVSPVSGPRTRTLPWMRRHAFLIGAAALTVVYSAYIVAVGNDYMAMHRFFVPVVPFIYLLAAAPLVTMSTRLPQHRAAFVVAAALVLVAAGGTFLHSTPLERHFIAASTNQHGNYRGVHVARWNVERLATIGRFFRSYRLSSDESLATNGIGAIGYLSDMRILDFNGLVDLHVAHTPIRPDQRLAGHQKTDYPYTIGLKPTYIMFGRDLSKQPGDFRGSVPAETRELTQDDYVVRSVWLEDKANGQSGYFSFLERRDHARPD